MKKTIIVVILFITINGYTQTHTGFWNYKQVSVDSLTEITQLFFADSLAGYLGGTFTSDAVFSSPVLRWFSTTDGGLSWSRIIFKGLPKVIQDYDIGNGCAPTHNSIFLPYADLQSYIYFSLNNGVLWDSIKASVDLSQHFTMFTEKEGIGIGGTNGGFGKPVIIKTTDGGHSFPTKVGDSLFTSTFAASNLFFLNAGDFSDDQHGTFIATDANINNGKGLTSLVTKNGGVSWEKFHTDFSLFANDTLVGNIQYQKGTPNLWLMPFKQTLSNTSDYYRWRGYPNRFSYCFSTNYGQTWNYDTSYFRRCAAIYGVSPSDIWMLLYQKNIERGGGDLGPSNTIVHSTDSGVTWDVDITSLINTFGNFDARAIYFSDQNHGWIAAIHKGLPYIFSYQPQRNTVYEQRIRDKQQLPVFPEPAINQVTINLPENYHALDVELYDIVGRKYSAPYIIHDNTVVLDTHHLLPGVWFAVVKQTYGTNTTRFILQK